MASYEDFYYLYIHSNLDASYNPNGRWIGNMVADDNALCGNRDITFDGDPDRGNFEGTCNKTNNRPYWCAHDRAATPLLSVRQLSISRHTTASLSNAQADAILNDASTVLQVDDGAGDVACSVSLVRSGNVTVFTTGDGSLDTNAELSAVFGLPGNVKVVDDVNFCGGFNPSIIGCGQTPGSSFITERFTANQEGILWAHEFGHNQGLPHRSDSTDNLMFPSIGVNRLRINQTECNAFLGGAGLISVASVAGQTPATNAG